MSPRSRRSYAIAGPTCGSRATTTTRYATRSPTVLRCSSAKATTDRVFEGPRVAIVGTRAATHHGLEDARELGGFLARAGVTVVSGLAIGIDGAAHEGALDAGGLVVGVVATGLDIEYPRRHRALYKRVREAGVVVTEHGYGVPPHPPRFPFRNRIIAALADFVVVVEATATGGARITREVRGRVRTRRLRTPRLPPQSGRGRVQRAHPRRRRVPARSG